MKTHVLYDPEAIQETDRLVTYHPFMEQSFIGLPYLEVEDKDRKRHHYLRQMDIFSCTLRILMDNFGGLKGTRLLKTAPIYQYL